MCLTMNFKPIFSRIVINTTTDQDKVYHFFITSSAFLFVLSTALINLHIFSSTRFQEDYTENAIEAGVVKCFLKV